MTQRGTCADCGGVLEHTRLWGAGGRPLCAICLHADDDQVKKDAEVWILERMYRQGTRLLMAKAELPCA